MNSLSVIIPVYNEEKSVEKVLHAVAAEKLVSEIIIVDDCSVDNSVEKIKLTIQSLETLRPELKLKFHQNKITYVLNNYPYCLKSVGSRFRLTRKGMLFADTIISELMLDDDH